MKVIHSILIANRGEIASRIILTCNKMGIKSIAIFSAADRTAPFVEQASLAVYIGASKPSASYLDPEKIIATAKKTGADAIHPGYGFLAENAGFAKRCEEEGIVFIGPSPEAIDAMGSKSKAKTLMKKHGVPVVPGYQGIDQSVERLSKEAVSMGFPVLLKAASGGGGKGMRIVREEKEMERAIQAAKRESKSAFGNDELIVEKYIASGRHIEFQIFGDKHGNTIHILERECSIQRRYQKVIEESPSPIMDEALRNRMGQAAVNAAKALNYNNAGTVEFIYDDKTGNFYFLEVNTRLQVEHPVTEEITGLDLVQMQIESAQGLPLQVKQEDIQSKGYAIEARLYAEDPSNGFLPVAGTILRFEAPEVDGFRIESAIRSGSEISAFYDPMIAKIIVWDKTRQAAHRKMQYVLRKLVCLGMTTNQDFLLKLLENEAFQAGNYDTHFIENKIDLSAIAHKGKEAIALAAMAATLHGWHKRAEKRTLLQSLPSGWRNNFYEYQQETYFFRESELLIRYHFQSNAFTFLIGDESYAVQLIEVHSNRIRLEVEGIRYQFDIAWKGNNFYVHNENTGNIELQLKERFPAKEVEKVKGGYEAPMPSQIIKVLVKEGQKVKSGDSLVILSSMKMENTIIAEEDGMVEAIYAEDGKNVEAGFLLVKLNS